MKRYVQIAVIASFAIILGIFAASTFLVKHGDISFEERRKLAALPKLRKSNWTQFPASFETYVSDRMGLRTKLVAVRNLVKCDLLHVSGNQRLVVGLYGWLWHLGEGSAPIFRHESLYTQEELEHWKEVLEQRTAWCNSHGVKYVFFVAPDKPSIYPEFLPDGWKPVRPLSRLQQLTDYLKDDPKLTFINPTKQIVADKNKSILYLKTDTHWNDRGAFIGYQMIMRALQKSYPQLQPRSLDQVSFETKPFTDGDCLNVDGLHGWKYELAPKVTHMEPVQKSNLRVLFFHDSFGERLQPYLQDHFAAFDLQKQASISCDPEDIYAHKPDIVLQEIVERRFSQQTPAFIDDWGHWLVDTVRKNDDDHGAWVCLLPHTEEIQVPPLLKCCKPEYRIRPITCRTWSAAGDSVSLDEKQALYPDFYVLKTGDQGLKFVDHKSEVAYQQLQSFVQAHYKRIGQHPLVDGSVLSVYKKAV